MERTVVMAKLGAGSESAVDAGVDGRHVAAIELLGVIAAFRDGDEMRRVLDGVDLAVRAGELVAVMGPSGSGKTTLLNVAAGLVRPSGGEVVVDGIRIESASRDVLARIWRTSVGIVEQRSNLLDDMTVSDNVGLPLELGGARGAQVREAVDDALRSVGLESRSGSRAGDLSTGQQQLVAIARALVGGRHIVVADEPTAALDPLAGEAVMKVLRRRCDAGAAALVATHDPEHAAWADRVLVLRDGALRTVAAGGVA
jgi:putative ABC transport system ATP-binding protein